MTEQLITITLPAPVSTAQNTSHAAPEMDAFLVIPDGDGPFPAVVVAHEAFGVNTHIQDVCRRLARENYVAIAPELFHRTGRGVSLGYDEISKAKQHFGALTNDGLTDDVNAAIAHLRGLSQAAQAAQAAHVDGARIGILGFCLGGYTAVLAACRTDVRVAVSFYGSGMVQGRPGLLLTPLVEEMDRIRAPVLAIFGGSDHAIPTEQAERVRARLAALDDRHQVHVYAGAGHGFFCDERAAFKPDAAADAWQRTLAFLRAAF